MSKTITRYQNFINGQFTDFTGAEIENYNPANQELLSTIPQSGEQEVDNAVDNLTTLLEPMIMAVLGVVIGGLIIAMYLPIFQIGMVV